MSRKLFALAALLAALTFATTAAAHGVGGGKHDDEIAGTVASFTGGVLTVNLGKGGTLVGTVTDRTRIKCRDARPGRHHGHGRRHHRRDDCGTEALSAGRQVKEADLKASNGEAVFKELKLGA